MTVHSFLQSLPRYYLNDLNYDIVNIIIGHKLFKFSFLLQYTDELTPLVEWLEDSKMKSTKELSSNSVAQTEEILERHEKNLNALDKKKKVYTDNKTKGEKLKTDPKCPPFLGVQLNLLNTTWKEANDLGDNR